jgi:hypothetical protein
MYDLYAVSNHMGGLGGEHYTALSLNRFDDLWYEFNDSSYRTVDESIHKHHTKTSYVLFYNRSEGDVSMPLNERSPIIRRQSVSRPDLWPHSQVEDRAAVRDFTRSSRITTDLPILTLPPLLGSQNNSNDSASSNKREVSASIKAAAADSVKKNDKEEKVWISTRLLRPRKRQPDIKQPDPPPKHKRDGRTRTPAQSERGRTGTKRPVHNGDSRKKEGDTQRTV